MKTKYARYFFAFLYFALHTPFSANAGTTAYFYDFNSGLPPSGWVRDPDFPSTQTNFANQRLNFLGSSFNQVISAINLRNVQSVAIEYDAHYGGAGFIGVGLETHAGKIESNITSEIGAGRYSTYGFQPIQQTLATTWHDAIDTSSDQRFVNRFTEARLRVDLDDPNLSRYHVKSTTTSTTNTISFLDLVSGQTISSERTVQNSALLSRNDYGHLNVYGQNLPITILHKDGFGAHTSNAGWIDNLKITVETRNPQQYGLFVGVRDQGSTGPALRGDVAAKQLYDTFASRYGTNNSAIITANLDSVNPTAITIADIRDQLNFFKSRGMMAGDNLVLYVSGHGASNFFGLGGYERIELGTPLFDVDLYNTLDAMDPTGSIRKSVFLDSCLSGGFWGVDENGQRTDFLEGNAKNLGDLRNIAFYASAEEGRDMYFDQTGVGFFSQALVSAFSQNFLETRSAPSLQQFLFNESKRLAASIVGINGSDPVYYSGALGMEVRADPTLIKSVATASFDFDNANTLLNNSVPEPPTLLLVTGTVALLAQRRKRQRV